MDEHSEIPQDDVSVESDASLPPELELDEVEEHKDAKIKKLQTNLKNCESEKRTHLEDLQRAKADFLNSKKRLEESAIQDRERILESFIQDLLPLCDSFHMAMSDTATWESVDQNWRSGIEGINSQLQRILSEHNVVSVDPLNEPFDPEKHEAVGTTESEAESNTIVAVLQLGFERNGTVLRPAKVTISA